MRISDWSSDVCSSDLCQTSQLPTSHRQSSRCASPSAGEGDWLHTGTPNAAAPPARIIVSIRRRRSSEGGERVMGSPTGCKRANLDLLHGPRFDDAKIWRRGHARKEEVRVGKEGG